MTDKNADVEWLRANLNNGSHWVAMRRDEARRLLAHIDQLDAEIRSWEAEVVMHHRESREDRRPTVHEIAAQIFVGWVRITGRPSDELLAASAYKAAEALVAEGRRRDGNS